MYLIHRKPRAKKQPMIYLAMFALSSLITTLFIGCIGGQDNKAKLLELSGSDTPIVVTGGSDYLDFGKEFQICAAGSPAPCPATAPTPPDAIYFAKGTLVGFAFYDDRDVNNHDPIPGPTQLNPGDTVTIYDKPAGSDRSVIIIKNSNPAGFVTIQFPEELNASNDPTNEQVFHHRSAKSRRRLIRKFTVDSVQLNTGAKVPVKAKATIEFYTQ